MYSKKILLKEPTECKLLVHQIIDKDDLQVYKSLIEALGIKNPFYATELLCNTLSSDKILNYFVFEIAGQLSVVMPFYKRLISAAIKGGNEYYDCISPYGYSGPLFNAQYVSPSHLTLFWNEVDSWYKKESIVSEFVRFSLNDNFEGYTGTVVPSLRNVKGKILDFDTQWKNFKPKVRNNYRKAQKENLNLEVYTATNNTPEIISLFYDIYISTMHRNKAHALFFHAKEYFINFIENNPDQYAIALVYKEKVAISAELILIEGKTLYSFLGGTLSEYFYTRPNDFLKIEVMAWARKHGFTTYVLGGGRANDDNLFKYKKTFFPKEEDAVFCTGRKILNPEIYDSLIQLNCPEESTVNNHTNLNEHSFFPLYRKND